MATSDASVIVVGVDGTTASSAALVFALAEGTRRDSVIEVVTAWTWGGGSAAGLPEKETHEEARQRAQSLQDAAVADALSGLDRPPVLSRRIIQGDAAEALVRAASAADYLVVGSARKGTLRRALLGSVSESCVRRARCPVVVVPNPAARAMLEHAS